MKTLHASILILSSFTATGLAHADDMSGMDMQNKPMTNQTQEKIHHAIGVVKKVDMVNNRVTIAHEPVASLHWPAMTMSFAVKDKKLFDQLTEGKKVEFDIVQTGGVATIVSVK